MLLTKNTYMVGIHNVADYSPFGVELDGRTQSGAGYRYSFQGQEKDDEVKGEGNSINTFFRQYDPRVCRWLSIDPKFKAFESPYVAYSNNPIINVDTDGADTTNFMNTIREGKHQVGLKYAEKSQLFNDFLSSFASGGTNEEINLVFEPVKDLRAFDNPESELDGQVLLMYKGKHVIDVDIPEGAELSDFSIVVQLKSDVNYDPSNSDYINARKGLVIVHEMFVHVESTIDLIDAAYATGTFNPTALVSSYKETMDQDHKDLYAGKKHRSFRSEMKLLPKLILHYRISKSISRIPITRKKSRNWWEVHFKLEMVEYF